MTFWWRRGKRAERGRGRPTRRRVRLATRSPPRPSTCHTRPLHACSRAASAPDLEGQATCVRWSGGVSDLCPPDSGSGELFKHGRAGPTPGRQTVARVHPRKGRPSSRPRWGRARGERNSGAGPAAPRRPPARQRRTPKPFAVSWSCWISSDARWLIKNEPWNVFPQPASEDPARVQWRRAPCRVYSGQEPRFLYFSGIWC